MGNSMDEAYHYNKCTFDKKNEELNMKDMWKSVENEQEIAITNIYVNLPGWRVRKTIADPMGAHSNYWEKQSIYQLLACGGSRETNDAMPCN